MQPTTISTEVLLQSDEEGAAALRTLFDAWVAQLDPAITHARALHVRLPSLALATSIIKLEGLSARAERYRDLFDEWNQARADLRAQLDAAPPRRAPEVPQLVQREFSRPTTTGRKS